MLTKQKIQGALRKAGFEASKSSTTNVRGWHNRTDGYKVWDTDTHICVKYVQNAYFLSAEETQRRNRINIDKFAAALEAFKPAIESNSQFSDAFPLAIIKIPKE